MICNKCGREIPDDSAYCGFCGASQSLDVTETLNKIEEEQMIEDAQVVEKTAPEENPEEEKSILPKIDLPKVDLPKVELPKVNMPKVNIDWSEFSQLWTIVKNPFDNIKLRQTPMLVIFFLAVIAHWTAVGKLATSFLICAGMICGAVLCEYLDQKQPRNLNTAVNRGAQRIFLPAILLLIAGLLRLSMGSFSETAGLTELFNQLSAMMIQVRVYLLLVIGAWVLLIMESARMTRKLNGYLVILIYVLLVAAAIFALAENGGTLLSALLSI